MLLLVGMLPSQVLASSWSTPTTGLWSNAARWTPMQVPGAGSSTATISAVGAAYQVQLSGAYTVSDFTLNSVNATLNIASGSSLTSNSAFRMISGTLNNSGTVNFSPSISGSEFEYAGGTIGGVLNVYNADLSIGPAGASGPNGGTIRIHYGSNAEIQTYLNEGGNILAGMTVDFRPSVSATGLNLRVPDVFRNDGTLRVTCPTGNNYVRILGIDFNNSGVMEVHESPSDASYAVFGRNFVNEADGDVTFHSDVEFYSSTTSNAGAMKVASNRRIYSDLRFTQISGSLDVGAGLETPTFEFRGGNVVGIVYTSTLSIGTAAGSGYIELRDGPVLGALISSPIVGGGGNIPQGVAVRARYEWAPQVYVQSAFINEGILSLHASDEGVSELHTNYSTNNGHFTNRGTYNVILDDNSLSEHWLYGRFTNENGGDANFGMDSRISGNVINQGSLRVDVGRTLTAEGSFAQGGTGSLHVTLAPYGYYPVYVEGNITLAGTLEISLADGFDPLASPPEVMEYLAVIVGSSRTGQFSSIVGSYLENGFYLKAGYTSNQMYLHLSQAGLGDTDLDGDVDLNDLSALAANYGSSGGADWIQGDFDHDGDVDLNDLSTLASRYGQGEAQAFADFAAVVPEPHGLVILALFGFGMRRRAIDRVEFNWS